MDGSSRPILLRIQIKFSVCLKPGIGLDLSEILQLQFLFLLILRGLSKCKFSQVTVNVFNFKKVEN